MLQKKQTWWTLANIPALQNLSGFLVDWATNTNVTPRHNHYLIHPKGEGELLRSTELFHMDVPVNRPHAKDFYRHEVSVNIGGGSVLENEFYDAIDQHVTPHGFDEDDVDGVSFTLPLSIDYMYNLNRRLGVGINIGWASISEAKYKWELMQIAGENILYIYGVDPESHAFYVLPTVRYKWWISANNRLSAYSKLALGYARTKFNVNEELGYNGNTLFPAYSTTRHRLGYQVTFAGMEFGRGHLRSFVEIGYGYKGFFNTGLKLCF